MNNRVSKVTIYSDYPGVTLVEFDRQDGHFRLRKIKRVVRAEMINRLVNSPSMRLQECVVLKHGYLTMRFVPVVSVTPEPVDNASNELVENVLENLAFLGYDGSTLSKKILIQWEIEASDKNNDSYMGYLETLAVAAKLVNTSHETE